MSNSFVITIEKSMMFDVNTFDLRDIKWIMSVKGYPSKHIVSQSVKHILE